jgi:cyclopropane-fatty-acyl-phospholipid synthase
MADPRTTTLAILEQLFAQYPRRDFEVRLWDGTTWPGDDGEPRSTLVLRHPGSLRALLLPPTQRGAGEAYVYGDVDIEGDIFGIYPVADYLLRERSLGTLEKLSLAARLRSLPPSPRARDRRRPPRLRARRYSKEYDRQAVTSHYDLPQDLFPLYLGRYLLYTSAYFGSPDEDLDTAQERKLDLICRKLRLQPGERLLDVGCGWGSLSIWAARHYAVRAHGVTLSEPQAQRARERAEEAGVADLVRFEARDYRDVDAGEPYDKIAAIEMYEHVAPHQLVDFFARVHSLLRPGGAFMNQGIVRRIDFDQAVARRGDSFMERWVWPNCVLVPVSEALRAAELAGFEIRDVENMRDHYTLTLTHWCRNVETNREQVIRLLGDDGYRLWRLWTAGAAYANERRHVGVHQVLHSRPRDGRSGLPLTRHDLYERKLAHPEREPAPA